MKKNRTNPLLALRIVRELELLNILKELVALKELKDNEGKTDDYLKRQPWDEAKRLLNEYKK